MKEKPKPLDLEGIKKEWRKLEREMRTHAFKLSKKTKQLICVSKIGLDNRKLNIVKQRIKSACEFFLKYWDKPAMFLKDFPEFEKEFIKLGFMTKNEEFTANICDEYVEWLFKLAFKGVLKEVKG